MPQKFRQSPMNLLSNACKFTENGRVTLRVEALQRGWKRVDLLACGRHRHLAISHDSYAGRVE